MKLVNQYDLSIKLNIGYVFNVFCILTTIVFRIQSVSRVDMMVVLHC